MLKEWDLHYDAQSKGAMLFESVYRAIIDVVFGDHGLGRDVIGYLFSETCLFNEYYVNLDKILEKPASAWFDNASRDTLLKQGIEEGLRTAPMAYATTRTITLAHLLFGGALAPFFGVRCRPPGLARISGNHYSGADIQACRSVDDLQPHLSQ